MILNFKVKNYRSYKKQVTFTMEAETSRSKMQNVMEVESSDNCIKALSTSVIFGANASGKSNIIKALANLIKFIIDKPLMVDEIPLYEPYLFDIESKDEPAEFELDFLGPDHIRYIYIIKISRTVVLSEQLSYLKGEKRKPLLFRENHDDGELVQKGELFNSNGKSTIVNTFANQLLLSKFGRDLPHEIISPILRYFFDYEFLLNRVTPAEISKRKKVSNFLIENPSILDRVITLIKAADTKIDDLRLSNLNDVVDRDTKLERLFSSSRENFQINSYHKVYHKGEKTQQEESLNFNEESKGSQMLYLIGGMVIMTIDRGGVLIIDELDTSLHPFLTKLIVMLFQSKKINKRNAQLIFTSHDVSLMDRDLLRKDQIWLTEKTDKGESNIYSLQDFENLREDTPFEKWYLAGKFGALPNITSIENIFDDTDAD
jgi:AAA15 family ATPase/GTPase